MIENAGDHWLRYGLVLVIKQKVKADGTISWTLEPWTCLLIHLIQLIKSFSIIIVTKPTKSFAIYVGDFTYFYGGLGSRFYINIAFCLGAIYPFIFLGMLIPKKNRTRAIRCLKMFQLLKIGRREGLLSVMSDRSYRKLTKYISLVMKILYPMFVFTVIFCLILSGIYFYQLDDYLLEFPIWLFWSLHFWLYVCAVCTLCYVHSIYFICLCYYVTVSIKDQNRQLQTFNRNLILNLTEISERFGINDMSAWIRNNILYNNFNNPQPSTLLNQNPYEFIFKSKAKIPNDTENEQIDHKALNRLFYLRGKLFQHRHILKVLNNLKLCYSEIQCCDQFYGSLFRAWILIFWFALMTVIYMTLYSGALENLANSLAVASLAVAVLTPYLASAMVTKHINETYKLLNRLMLKPMPVITKWHYQLIIELVASKRNRVGFKVRHWYTLNRWNLIKVNIIIVEILMLKLTSYLL